MRLPHIAAVDQKIAPGRTFMRTGMEFLQIKALGSCIARGAPFVGASRCAISFFRMVLYYALFFLIFVLPALIELGAFFGGIWWHSDGPKDRRNGL